MAAQGQRPGLGVEAVSAEDAAAAVEAARAVLCTCPDSQAAKCAHVEVQANVHMLRYKQMCTFQGTTTAGLSLCCGGGGGEGRIGNLSQSFQFFSRFF
jgi:hypothetical protein